MNCVASGFLRGNLLAFTVFFASLVRNGYWNASGTAFSFPSFPKFEAAISLSESISVELPLLSLSPREYLVSLGGQGPAEGFFEAAIRAV